MVNLPAGRFHYREFGEPDLPPAVLLHGTGMHSGVWMPHGRALAERFHVFALDLRGHGDSIKSPTSFRGSDFGGDLRDFILALELDMPLCVGHSMGGATIILAEDLHPGLVGRAVLIDPILMPQSDYGEHWSIENDRMASGTLKRKAVWESAEAMIESFTGRPPFDTWRADQIEDYVRLGIDPAPGGEVRLKCSPEDEARTYVGARFTDPWPAIAKFAPPALVVRVMSGHTTKFLPLREAAELMPRGRLIEIPDVSHFLPMEDPDLVVRVIFDFDDETRES